MIGLVSLFCFIFSKGFIKKGRRKLVRSRGQLKKKITASFPLFLPFHTYLFNASFFVFFFGFFIIHRENRVKFRKISSLKKKAYWEDHGHILSDICV